MAKKGMLLAALLALAPGFAQAQHDHGGGYGGHGSHGGSSGGSSHRDEDREYDRIQKIEKKKMKIETQLRDANLRPAKRAKLEKKLEELNAQH